MTSREVALLVLSFLLASAMVSASSEVARTDGRPMNTEASARQVGANAPEPDSTQVDNRVVVYYFHRTARCDNCLKFEAYTDSLLHVVFNPELSEGVLEWRVVNLDGDGGKGFVEQYALDGITLLSSIVIGGEELSWRPLDDIWWLVDDRSAFADYVALEVIADLEVVRGKHAPEATSHVPLHRRFVPKPEGAGSAGGTQQ